jgi:mono/diheme cytochrome c family protein
VRVALLSLALVLATPALCAARSANDVAEGRKLFAGLCVTCHGFDDAGGAGLLSPGWTSLLSTAGGLVFGGSEEGNFFALGLTLFVFAL